MENRSNTTFRSRVLAVVAAIPCGETLTYGQVARRAGNERAARAVGAIMRTNFDPAVPCHRVVSSTGVGGYNRGVAQKRERLAEEGVSGY